ncbi:hypothetical protein GRF29_1g3553560 [Pseudopithomyces chartarum]|uniref:G domain-containing protein n=1 Tax=Pseudopithomyces chartarum TaxID=1892770 RepID=A0AAN6M721_9PLEO|nr:hypothetical protein GRF29_1g3553560 [Pseudopithomyces chartarum]
MSLTPYYNQYHTQDSTNYQSYAVGYYNQSVASQLQAQQRPPVIIAVFGKTGTGKTTFVRNVTNADYEVGHGLTSQTKVVQPAEATIEGRKVTLVDTPGFDDTHLTDREVLKLIADWLKYTYDEGTRLSGLLFFHNISSDRMEGSALKNLHMFRQLCGDHNLRNVVLTTTKWSVVNEDVGLRREKELIQNFWADMISKGSRVDRVGNDAHTATNLVRTFFSNPFFVPQLQQELVDGKPLSQTAAGSEVSREIRKIRAEYKKQLADAKAEMEQARTKESFERAGTAKK